jgi:hypothetical protein
MRLRARFEPEPPSSDIPQEPASRLGISDLSISPAACNLALAYHLDDLIEKGLLADYTAAARLLGVSQVRVTHLMSLLLLAPTIQDAIVCGTLAPSDKQLRQIARVADWARLGRVAGSPGSG